MGVETISGYSSGQGSQVSSTTTTTSATEPTVSTGASDTQITESASSNVSASVQNPLRESGEASTEQIKQAVDKINRSAGNKEAIFGIHEATNRVMIKIVDKESKEVLKEYPAEETLDMIAKVWENAGILVDEKR